LHATQGLLFEVQDMREPFPGKFDFILNLFTSFGYFAHETDNMKVLGQVSESLNPQGIFVLDFMNATKVVAGLVAHESKIIDDIVFIIRRRVENGIILKDIHVKDGSKTFDFQERVQALDHNQISDMLEKSGLRAFKAWGDYQGGEYHANSSDRLIIFAKHQN